jgi:hypothetical protein
MALILGKQITTSGNQNVSGTSDSIGFFPYAWPEYSQIQPGWRVVDHPDWVVTTVNGNDHVIEISGGTFQSGNSYAFVGSTGFTINGGVTLRSQVVDPTLPTVSSESPFAGLQSYFFEGTQARLQYSANNLSVDSDWTIEWFQKETLHHSYPRAFCVADNLFGVSMENGAQTDPGTFYLWTNDSPHSIYSATRFDAWHHFAISTVSGVTTVYQNGFPQGAPLAVGAINTSGQRLYLGGKAAAIPNEYFGGYITDMRWTVGVGVYTSNFTVPSTPLQLTQAGDGFAIQAITPGQVKFFLEPGRDYLA